MVSHGKPENDSSCIIHVTQMYICTEHNWFQSLCTGIWFKELNIKYIKVYTIFSLNNYYINVDGCAILNIQLPNFIKCLPVSQLSPSYPATHAHV